MKINQTQETERERRDLDRRIWQGTRCCPLCEKREGAERRWNCWRKTKMELDRRNWNRWRSQQNRSLCIPNGGGHWREPEEYTSSLCSHCNSNTQIFHTFFFSFSLFFFFSLLLPSSSSAKFKKREGGVDRLDKFDFLSFFLFLGFSRNKYGNFFFLLIKM